MKILKIKLEMEALISEREGMIALNKEREINDLSLAYGESAFNDLAIKFSKLALKIKKAE